MLKKLSVLSLVLLWTLVAAASAFSRGAEEVFVEKCMSCHRVGGEAAPVNPSSKAASVWVRFFKRGSHKTDLSKELSSEEMKEVIIYLMRHAADSDQPLTAVIPK